MQELDAIIELLVMLVKDVRTDILFALLILAAVIDYRTYRIPNWLTGAGSVIGLLFAATVSLTAPHGLTWALYGLLVGLFLTLPLYVLRTMGAGDVKLMAMTGAFIGVDETAYAVFAALLVGGIAALTFAVIRRVFGRMLVNIKTTTQVMAWAALAGIRPDASISAPQSVGRLPFGVSIAVGAIGYVVARQFGFV